MVTIRHATTTGPIDEPQWNEDHTITGLAAIAESGAWADLVSIPAPIANTTAAFTIAQESKLAGIAAGATVNQSDAFLLSRANHTGTQAISTVNGLQAALDAKQPAGSYALTGHVHTIAEVTGLQLALDGKQPVSTVLSNTTASFTVAQEAKLAGIAAGATVNATDAALRDRATHTGSQPASSISDFAATARAQVEAMLVAGSGLSLTPSGSGASRQLLLAASGGDVESDYEVRVSANTSAGQREVVTTRFPVRKV